MTMQRLIGTAIFGTAAVLGLGVGAFAAPPKTDADLLGVTCGQYQAALKAANPGAKASETDKARATAAQDDIASAMMWVHGYQSGRAGAGKMKPLTRSWMVAEVGAVAKACTARSPDGAMRLADVAASL